MKCNTAFKNIKEYILPKDAGIQVAAFNILALCGIAVSILATIVNTASGNNPAVIFADLSGVFISWALIVYCHNTGNYKMAMTLTAFIIFMGLFTALFFIQGGYHSGIPAFFIFGVVFTSFLLDGMAMVVLVSIEIVWYTALIIWSYYHPEIMNNNEYHYMTRVILDMVLVALSLAVTMHCQILVYRKKQQELNIAVLAADEANRAKSDFLAKMSHDIRTPLNTIMAMNEMIISNTSSAKIREWVNDSNISSRILMTLIDDMLDLTKIEMGHMKLIEQPWDTRKLFDETARAWKIKAEKSDLSFDYDIDGSVPDYLIGDEDVIRKIMNNLLSNSIKYTHSGCVMFTARMEEQNLVIAVSDTGVGIAPEYLENIFKPFDRGAQTIYKETSGSGLGLAIVKELVDAVNGTINCNSVVDEGTTFTARLPQKETVVTDDNAGAEAEEMDDHKTDMQFIAPEARILVVDDNPSNRKVIDAFLEPTLISIDDVESGYEALEMLDIKKYDLVLMDLRMPKMDGSETLEKIRTDYPDFDTPVVVLTADIMNGVKEKLLDNGFTDFLAKPVNSRQLCDIIRQYIPGKIVPISTQQENELTLARVENLQDILMPYGINLKMALEYNAGNTDEFIMRAGLFDQYADEAIKAIETPESREGYCLQIHSIKSIARGVGAYFLAQLAETDELRNNHEYSEEIKDVIADEYRRVRHGLEVFRKEAGAL